MTRSDARIAFDHVWKKFHRGESHDSLRDLIPAVARRMVGRAPRPDTELATDDFWAVKDLSFDVGPGHTLGIIGPNGSGKSTTLRLLTKILTPTRGHAEVRGRVGALIEVSAGFHGDLTGRENVYLQGAIMGMRHRQIERMFDEIVGFSEIEDFIDTPVKRYSSGMNARLGFSIAAHLEPDVLIIDEVLAVGDYAFQQKAFGRIQSLATSGIPVVIVSHQLERVLELCSEAILLRKGAVAYRGSPAETVGAYMQQLDGYVPQSEDDPGIVRFDSVRPVDDRPVVSGTMCSFRVNGRISDKLPDQIEPVKFRFRALHSGRSMYTAGVRQLGTPLDGPGAFSVEIALQANVPAGNYFLEVVAHDAVTQEDLVIAPPVMVLVTDDVKRWNGPIQLNAETRILTPEG